MTLREIYEAKRSEGLNPNESAKAILDIVTNGTWAVWDSLKIDRSLDTIVNKFEN